MDKVLDDIFTTTLEIHRTLRHRFMKSGEDRLEINPLQLFALFAIRDQEGLSMRELAGALQITPPSATSFANRLVKYGWIARKQDATNRKIVRLFVTQKGKSILAHHLEKKNALMKNILSSMTIADQKDLLRILKNLCHNISSKA